LPPLPTTDLARGAYEVLYGSRAGEEEVLTGVGTTGGIAVSFISVGSPRGGEGPEEGYGEGPGAESLEGGYGESLEC
jgi:hypothetical protein